MKKGIGYFSIVMLTTFFYNAVANPLTTQDFGLNQLMITVLVTGIMYRYDQL